MPVSLVRRSDEWHPDMPPPLRGGQVDSVAPTRRPPAPPHAQRELVSTPSGCAPSVAPSHVPRAEFPTGSMVELHRNVLPVRPPARETLESIELLDDDLLEDEDEDEEVAARPLHEEDVVCSVDVTFSDAETEHPTQRMQRRSSVPAPSPHPAAMPHQARFAERAPTRDVQPRFQRRPTHAPAAPVRESVVVPRGSGRTSAPPIAPAPRMPTGLSNHASHPAPARLAPQRSEMQTLVHDDSHMEAAEASGDSHDRHARIPEPPPPQPMDRPDAIGAGANGSIVPAIRVAIYTARDGTPQLALHSEDDPVGAPTAVLLPDCREDALRILQLFRRAEPA